MEKLSYNGENEAHIIGKAIQYCSREKTWCCQRCGEIKFLSPYFCERCQSYCYYCRECLQFGFSSSCMYRIAIPSTTYPSLSSFMTQPHVQLSPFQQQLSQDVVHAIEQNKSLLLWAVCGAGKTEMIFAGIQKALELRKRICIATPRKDVVLELFPRIQVAFPTVPMIALYGGSDDEVKDVPITIATTHQCIHYYNYFDVIFLDEADAFPYSFDQRLQFFLQKARKKNGNTIFITATPNKQLLQLCKKEHIQKKILPLRYHLHPIPVPTLTYVYDWKKYIPKHKIPFQVEKWLQTQLQMKKQVFFFVPTVQIQKELVCILRTLFSNSNVEGVSSEDEHRIEKVKAFRDGTIQLLVTTTILERGITVPNVSVCVLGAEERIFTESALVQIAGRAGRSANFPNGDVIFFHNGRTRDMIKAILHIVKMNDRGKELLKKEGIQ